MKSQTDWKIAQTNGDTHTHSLYYHQTGCKQTGAVEKQAPNVHTAYMFQSL